MDPELTVIIPTKGYEPFLEDLLASLFQQRPFVPMEVLVVDASLTDWRNKFTVAAWAFAKDDTWDIRYVFQENGRKGFAANLGAHEARSDRLLYLDADIVLPPEAVRWALAYLSPAYGYEIVSALRDHEQMSLSVFSEWMVRWWGFVTPWFCLIPKATLEKLGGWSDNYLEDADLWIQTRRRGYRVGFIPVRVTLKRRVRSELRKTWHFIRLVLEAGGVFTQDPRVRAPSRARRPHAPPAKPGN